MKTAPESGQVSQPTAFRTSTWPATTSSPGVTTALTATMLATHNHATSREAKLSLGQGGGGGGGKLYYAMARETRTRPMERQWRNTCEGRERHCRHHNAKGDGGIAHLESLSVSTMSVGARPSLATLGNVASSASGTQPPSSIKHRKYWSRTRFCSLK